MKVAKYDLQGKFLEMYNSISEAARSIDSTNCSSISACCRGRLKTAGGYMWRYVENDKFSLFIEALDIDD